MNGNRFYLSIPLFWLTWTPLLGHLPPVTFKEGDADLILETDISTSLLQFSLSFRHLVLFGLVYVYVFLFCCGFYSLQTQTSNILVWDCWLCWCIICLAIFSYLCEQGHLRRIATDSLGKESTSGNGSVPYVSSFLMAFYLKGPSDTIYFTLLPERRISFPGFAASSNISWRTNYSRFYLAKLVYFCCFFCSSRKKPLQYCSSWGCVSSWSVLLFLPASPPGVAEPA